jgi:hypothetical protein
MASIPIENAPRFLSMQHFRAISDRYGGLSKSCRFLIHIKPGGRLVSGFAPFTVDLVYLCEIAELPGRGYKTMDEIHYYGPSFKLPFQTTYEDISLTFLCRTKSFERQFFDDWMFIINPNNTFDFNYRDDYRAEIDVYQFGEAPGPGSGGAPEPQYKITLHDAFPTLVNPQPTTWGDDQFQRLVVSFTYMKWSRIGLEPTARGDYGNRNFSFSLAEGRTVER